VTPVRLTKDGRHLSAGTLTKAVRAYAKQAGTTDGRARSWVAYMMLSGLLQKVARDEGGVAMTVKGGVALELRLHPTPRATDDIDLVIHGAEDLMQSLDRSLLSVNDEPRVHGGFTFQRKGEPRDLLNGAWRVEIAVRYEGGAWNTISVDLAGEEIPNVAPEYIPAINLAPLLLPGPDSVPCLPLNHQLAQKIHGMTQPPREGRRNERAKDLVDVLLLGEFIEDVAALRQVCVSVFEARGAHEWPPMLEVLEHWRDEFRRLSEEYGLKLGSLEEGVAEARELIARIDRTGK
jgi:hypothetical protein